MLAKTLFALLLTLTSPLLPSLLTPSLSHSLPRDVPEPLPCTTRLAPQDAAVASWLAAAQAGQVLCLTPGTYRGSANMVTVEGTTSGTPEAPIWVRAEVEGTVVIDGEDSRRPVHLAGDYTVVWGLETVRGDNANVRFVGRHNAVLRHVSVDVGTNGDANFQLGGQYNLLADCVALGPARKQIPVGAATAGPGYNTVRRCYAAWASNPHTTSNPTNAGEVGYGQDDVTYENNVMTYALAPGGRSTEPEGVFQLFATQRSRVLGNIFYVDAGADFRPPRVVGASSDAGSHSQQGQYHPTTDLLFEKNVAYVDPLHPRFAELEAYRFGESSEGGPPGARNILRALVGVSGKPIVASTASWPEPSQVQWGTSLAAAIGTGKSLWTESVAAPAICHRVVAGQQTTRPLWPWPMNQRAKDAMARYGLPVVDITAQMEALFGTIPEACKTGGTPDVPPQPSPPKASLACTGMVQAVPGRVDLVCTPHAP